MNIRPASQFQLRAVEKSRRLLSDALTCAKAADCPRLCRRIRAAISSAKGAVRHANKRAARTAGHRQIYGVLHPMRADRVAFQHVEKPARSPWFRAGQYA